MAGRGDLVRKILEALGVAQSGQDLPPEDYNRVNLNLPTLLLATSKADVYTVPSPENIPDEAVDDLADYLAGRFIKVFGLVGEDATQVEKDALKAERALRRLRVMGTTGSRQRAEYF